MLSITVDWKDGADWSPELPEVSVKDVRATLAVGQWVTFYLGSQVAVSVKGSIESRHVTTALTNARTKLRRQIAWFNNHPECCGMVDAAGEKAKNTKERELWLVDDLLTLAHGGELPVRTGF